MSAMLADYAVVMYNHNMIELTCMGCEETFKRSVAQHRSNLKRGRKIVACSPTCVNICKNGYPKSNIITGECLECKQPFSRKWHKNDLGKYCSKACSNRFLGRKNKKTQFFCRRCEMVEVAKARILCSGCRGGNNRDQTREINYDEVTIGELRARYSTSQFHAKVRGAARSMYKRHNGSMSCENCGYSLHIDVCHIRPVSDFPPGATLNEVNDFSNLIGLDKRCHWEFDNGFLSLEEIRPNSPTPQ